MFVHVCIACHLLLMCDSTQTHITNVSVDRYITVDVTKVHAHVHYTPETKFGGVYRSHPVVGRAVGRSSGPLRFPFPIQLHTMIKHMERKCSAQEK